MAKDKQSFRLEGRFEGFMAGGKSPFKYLSLHSADEQHLIKLTKPVRLMIFRYLQAGDWIRVVGIISVDKKTGEPRLKAQEVMRIKAPDASSAPVAPEKKQPSAKKKKKSASKILICQRSACRKRGAGQICHEVEAALAAQGLTDTVQVKLTGCMDKCKAGPNVVVMPDKQRYTKVKPGQVSDLVAQHFRRDEVGSAS